MRCALAVEIYHCGSSRALFPGVGALPVDTYLYLAISVPRSGNPEFDPLGVGKDLNQ